MPDHRAHESKETGGIWMNILAEKLRTTDASVLDVLTKVNTELCREFHTDQVGCYQQPELVSRLNEEVHLLREARAVNEEVHLLREAKTVNGMYNYIHQKLSHFPFISSCITLITIVMQQPSNSLVVSSVSLRLFIASSSVEPPIRDSEG